MREKPHSERLAEGDILVRAIDKIPHRVVYLGGDDVVIFNMVAPANSALTPRDATGKKHPPSKLRPRPAVPETWKYSDLIDEIYKERFQKTPAEIPFIDRKDLRPSEIAFQSRALPIVEALVAQEPHIYDPEMRAKLVAEACKKFGVTRQTTYKYLRVFWAGGKIPAALISFFRHCGAPGIRRIAGSAKRGRPRSPRMTAELGIGVNTNAEDFPNIRSAVKAYQKNTEWILDDAYYWMLDSRYSKVVTSEDGRRSRQYEESKVITFDQFEYHANEFMTAEDKRRRIDERGVTDGKNGREFKGGEGSLPEVGEIAEIDALRTNLSICTTKGRAVIGTAVVVIIVEYKSGLILGLAIGLAGEVFELVVEALVNSVRDKVEWCNKYGVHIRPEQWPTRHFCQRLHADRGPAFFGHLSDRIGEVISPNPFANTGPFQPKAKGRVENTVRLFKRMIRRRIKGAWVGKFSGKQRGSRSPHEMATRTVSELMTELLEIAVDINEKVRKGRRTEPDLVARGVDSSPLSIVTDALETQRHRFRRIEPIALEQALLPRFDVTVSLGGIDFGHELYYAPASDVDLASDWYRKLELEEADAQVAMHRDTVDTCFLIPPGQRGRFVRCVRLTKSNQFAGMSLAEVKAIRQERRATDGVANAKNTPNRVKRFSDAQARGARAEAETRRATGNVPSSQRDIGNRRENRKQEQRDQREKLNRRLSEQGNPPSQPASPAAEQNPTAPYLGYPDLDAF